MKQTPKTGPSKTPSLVDSLLGFSVVCLFPQAVAECAEADTGACARGRLGAVPLGNTGTTTVEGTR